MFFAAGFGTRMRYLTRDRPKPLIQVGGKALIDHAVDFAVDATISKMVGNVHYHADMMAAHLTNRGVITSDERDEILETGGGLRKALPLLGGGPVYTMNTDAVWKGPNPFSILDDAWLDHMEALLLLVPPNRAHAHAGGGSFAMNAENQIRWDPQLIYTGAQIVRPNRLSMINKSCFSLRELWDDMLSRNAVYGVMYSGDWCDVGHPDAIAIAEEMLNV
jgi:MurNAc alpha-1-phosphate uridylyltransferase